MRRFIKFHTDAELSQMNSRQLLDYFSVLNQKKQRFSSELWCLNLKLKANINVQQTTERLEDLTERLNLIDANIIKISRRFLPQLGSEVYVKCSNFVPPLLFLGFSVATFSLAGINTPETAANNVDFNNTCPAFKY